MNKMLAPVMLLLTGVAVAEESACTLEKIAGRYDSQWGPINCKVADDALECCYGNLTTCRKKLYLSLSDSHQLSGRWEYATGTRGPAAFSVDLQCNLGDGFWGSGTIANSAWAVSGRIAPAQPVAPVATAPAVSDKPPAPSRQAPAEPAPASSPEAVAADQPQPGAEARRAMRTRRQAPSVDATASTDPHPSSAGSPVTKAPEADDPAKAKAQAEALYQKGNSFAFGRGVEQDYRAAIAWWRQAAALGHAGAQYNLNVSYREGLGVGKDQTAAVRWAHMAAEQDEPNAQLDLGLYYSEGMGVERDLEQSAKWVLLAAEQGLPKAYHALAIIYGSGFGVSKDETASIMWIKLAADAGVESIKDAWTESVDEVPADQLADAERMAREWQARVDLRAGSSNQPGQQAAVDGLEVIGSADAPHLFTVHYSVGCHHCLLQLDEALPVIKEAIRNRDIRLRLLESSDASRLSSGPWGIREAADALYCIRDRRPQQNSLDLLASFIALAKASVAEDAKVGWYQWFYAKPEELVGVASVQEIGARFLAQYGLNADTSCKSFFFERDKRAVERRFKEKGYSSVPTAEFDGAERDAKIGVFLSRKLAEVKGAAN